MKLKDSTTLAQVQSLFGELRSCKPCGHSHGGSHSGKALGQGGGYPPPKPSSLWSWGAQDLCALLVHLYHLGGNSSPSEPGGYWGLSPLQQLPGWEAGVFGKGWAYAHSPESQHGGSREAPGAPPPPAPASPLNLVGLGVGTPPRRWLSLQISTAGAVLSI